MSQPNNSNLAAEAPAQPPAPTEQPEEVAAAPAPTEPVQSGTAFAALGDILDVTAGQIPQPPVPPVAPTSSSLNLSSLTAEAVNAAPAVSADAPVEEEKPIAAEGEIPVESGPEATTADDAADLAVHDPMSTIPRVVISDAEAKKITISRTFAWKYADLPYFAAEVAGFFVRVRVGQKLYKWDRIIKCSFDGQPYRVESNKKGKNFNITFHLETSQMKVKLDSLSSTPPTIEEVEAFQDILRANMSSAMRDGLKDDALPKAFPDMTKIHQLVQHMETKVIKREKTEDDARAIIRLNSKLYGNNNNPVVHTSVLEKNSFLMSQTLRRSASNVNQESGMGPTQNSFEGFQTQMTQLAGGDSQDIDPYSPTLGRQATVIAGATGTPARAPSFGSNTGGVAPMSMEMLESQESQLEFTTQQATAVNDSFAAYIANEKRSKQIETAARISERNSQHNAMLRERGGLWEERLQRKGNLVESSGLWEVDDTKRVQLAEAYDEKKEAEREENQKKEEKKNESKEEEAARKEREAQETIAKMEEQFFERATRTASESQSMLDPASQIPDDIFALARQNSSSSSTFSNNEPSSPAGGAASAATAILSSSPSMLARLHMRDASQTFKDGRKRVASGDGGRAATRKKK